MFAYPACNVFGHEAQGLKHTSHATGFLNAAYSSATHNQAIFALLGDDSLFTLLQIQVVPSTPPDTSRAFHTWHLG